MELTPTNGGSLTIEESDVYDCVIMKMDLPGSRDWVYAKIILDDENLVKLENYLAFRRENKKSFTLDDVNPPMCSNHVEVQHRDRLPPWCNNCGWSHGKPAVKARKYGGS